jgi:hypothetical protein
MRDLRRKGVLPVKTAANGIPRSSALRIATLTLAILLSGPTPSVAAPIDRDLSRVCGSGSTMDAPRCIALCSKAESDGSLKSASRSMQRNCARMNRGTEAGNLGDEGQCSKTSCIYRLRDVGEKGYVGAGFELGIGPDPEYEGPVLTLKDSEGRISKYVKDCATCDAIIHHILCIGNPALQGQAETRLSLSCRCAGASRRTA